MSQKLVALFGSGALDLFAGNKESKQQLSLVNRSSHNMAEAKKKRTSKSADGRVQKTTKTSSPQTAAGVKKKPKRPPSTETRDGEAPKPGRSKPMERGRSTKSNLSSSNHGLEIINEKKTSNAKTKRPPQRRTLSGHFNSMDSSGHRRVPPGRTRSGQNSLSSSGRGGSLAGRGKPLPGRGLSKSAHSQRSTASLSRRSESLSQSAHSQASKESGLSTSSHGKRMVRQASRNGLSTSAHGKRPTLTKQTSAMRSSRLNNNTKNNNALVKIADGGDIIKKDSTGSRQGRRSPLVRQESARQDKMRRQKSTAGLRMQMDGLVEEVNLNLEERPKLRPKRSFSMDASLSNEFNDDPWFKRGLRYIAILPPTPNEEPMRRKQRLYIWIALCLDYIAAIVSLATYGGVTTCCEEPIFNFAANINWNKFILIFTYVYLVMLFLEIFPVMRKGLPFNLLNPLLGFTITVAMFFDDRIIEAAIMWAIEAMAVLFESLVYRLKFIFSKRTKGRIQDCTNELALRKDKSRRTLNGSVDSFDDSIETQEEPVKTDFSKLDNFRIERERRHLQMALNAEEVHLRYYFIGTIVNIGLVILSLSLIIGIARNGGLCIYHMQAPDPFNTDQLGLCNKCNGTGACQVCDTSGNREHQCYFPYL